MKNKIAIVDQWPNLKNAERENVRRISASAMALGVEVIIIDKWGCNLVSVISKAIYSSS